MDKKDIGKNKDKFFYITPFNIYNADNADNVSVPISPKSL